MFIRRSEVCCSVMGWGYVWGEVKELVEEIKKLDFDGVLSEFLDVYSCGMCWLSDVSGLDLWILRNKNVVGWEKRWNWFRRFLELRGLEFNRKMMRNGANYKKWSKVYNVWKEGVDGL